jgi:hypothetical protein
MQSRSDRSELSIRSLSSQVKVLSNVKQAAFETSLAEFKPTFVYIGSGASFEGQNAEQGALLPFSFKGDKSSDALIRSMHASLPLTLMQTDPRQVES